jgi:chemotaxis protein histidine kinase CheA
MKLFDYIKVAFMQPYHLVSLGGAIMFAVISPVPDAILALAAAAEALYIGGIALHPKFQTYVDAQAAKIKRAEVAKESEKTLERILKSLPRDSYERFERLRKQCLELQQMANDLGRSTDGDDYRIAGLDKLLWIYIKLLYSQYALLKFIDSTNDRSIQAGINKTQTKLNNLPADASPKIRKALEDNLKTCQERLGNIKKANENSDLVALQIEGLENKIKSLGELAINRQEPDYISGQVDEVVSGMTDSEKAISDLDFMTGLGIDDDSQDTPQLLQSERTKLRLAC